MIPLYTFYQVVYFKHYGPEHFPSKSPEAAGRFVGFAETVGHALTFKVLRDSTSQILYRSRLRTALEEGEENLRAKSNPAPPAKNIDVNMVQKDYPLAVARFYLTETHPQQRILRR